MSRHFWISFIALVLLCIWFLGGSYLTLRYAKQQFRYTSCKITFLWLIQVFWPIITVSKVLAQ